MIHNVLRQRHIKEAVHLEDHLDQDKKTRLAEAASKVNKQRVADREKLLVAFEKVRYICLYTLLYTLILQ